MGILRLKRRVIQWYSPAMFLRRTHDRKTLAVEAITLLVILFAVWLPFSWTSLLLIPILGSLSFICCIINHNNKHNPILKNRTLNQLNDCLVSICIGSPATRLHLVHQYNHHAHFRDDRDWSRYSLAGDTRGLTRILKYLALATREIVAHRDTLVFPSRFKRELAYQRVTLALFVMIAALINWKSLFLVVGTSWIIGLYSVLTANFVNHDGCELKDEWKHSRNFLSDLENWIFFNNGYHAAHHLRPEAHWSELKEIHTKSVAPQTNSSTNEGSFFRYLFYKYILKQKTYSLSMNLLESKEV